MKLPSSDRMLGEICSHYISFFFVCYRRVRRENAQTRNNSKHAQWLTFEYVHYKSSRCVMRDTYLPKTISFGRRNLAVCQHGRRSAAAEIEFDIKFIGLIYRPPDMRRRERERYGYDVDVRLVEFGLEDACGAHKHTCEREIIRLISVRRNAGHSEIWMNGGGG